MPKIGAGEAALGGLAGFAKGMMEGMKFNREMDFRDAQIAATATQRTEGNKLAKEKFDYQKEQDVKESSLSEKKYNLDVAKFLKDNGDEGKETSKLGQDIAINLGRSTEMTKSVNAQMKRLSEIRQLGLTGGVKSDDASTAVDQLMAIESAIDEGNVNAIATHENNLSKIGFDRGNTRDYIDAYIELKDSKKTRTDLFNVIDHQKSKLNENGKRTMQMIDKLKAESSVAPEQLDNLGATMVQAGTGDRSAAMQSFSAIKSMPGISEAQREEMINQLADSLQKGAPMGYPSMPESQLETEMASKGKSDLPSTAASQIATEKAGSQREEFLERYGPPGKKKSQKPKELPFEKQEDIKSFLERKGFKAKK